MRWAIEETLSPAAAGRTCSKKVLSLVLGLVHLFSVRILHWSLGLYCPQLPLKTHGQSCRLKEEKQYCRNMPSCDYPAFVVRGMAKPEAVSLQATQEPKEQQFNAVPQKERLLSEPVWSRHISSSRRLHNPLRHPEPHWRWRLWLLPRGDREAKSWREPNIHEQLNIGA